MSDPQRAELLGLPVDLIDVHAAAQWIGDYVRRKAADSGLPPALVVTLNPEMVVLAQHDRGFAGLVEKAAMVLPDGIGLVRALRRRGHRQAQRAAGADVLEMYLRHAAREGQRVAFVGARHGAAQLAAANARARLPELQVMADGGEANSATAERVLAFRPDVVFAAYGAGPQERFLDLHLTTMGAAVGMGVGGSFDYLAGRVPRAPALVRRLQLEWLWRLLLQPWRWRRQTALPRFWWMERNEHKHDA